MENQAQITPLSLLYAPRPLKFVLMNMTTIGFYTIYWGYQNWAAMRQAGRTFAWPIICAIFLPLTLRSMLDKAEPEREKLGVPDRQLTMAAVLFFLINVLTRLPVYGIAIGVLTFLPLLRVNSYLASINQLNGHDSRDIDRFSVGNIVAIFIGLCLLALNIIGLVTEGQ